MSNWAYSDWRTQPSDAAKLERLNLHMEEVSLRITETVASEGQSINTDVLYRYLEFLQKQYATPLEDKVEKAAGRKGPAFLRGRA